MIVENDCLILHIFPMDDGETREEVPMDVMIHKPAEREAQLMQANREELVERIGRAMREDGTPAVPRAAPVPPLLASGTTSRCERAIGGRDCPGEQGSPSGREPLPLRPVTVS